MAVQAAGTKKKIKGEIKFGVQLNDEQKRGKELIRPNKIAVLMGEAGSGKTLLACQIALDSLFRKEVDQIILSRPLSTVDEDLGFLPGDKEAKLAPYIAAIYDNMEDLVGKEKLESLIHSGEIKVIPLGFIRGRNIKKSIVLLDESQNATKKQLKAMVTRICAGTKIILCGDSDQIDLEDERHSGFLEVVKKLSKIAGVTVVHLLKNHRDPIVLDILKALD